MSSENSITMASDKVIQCSELGKCYQIYENPKARLKQALWKGRRQYYREFWSLRHINFEVRRGESLGIIGRNGSGKSTLLQIICGTLTPTEGTVQTKGRIAALLELGSGFNPEFTGIENVYLNASMLGLSKEETDKRLDDILAFADIGNFLSQPVKTYSSGMAVRLAFAVVAHVDADILVVDEALAVGDAIFVQRCMRFIRRIREERCLLFVSHDTEAVKSLCSHSIWLSKGKQLAYGTCKGVVLDYTRYCYAASSGEEIIITGEQGASQLEIQGVESDLTRDLEEKAHDYEVIATQSNNLEAAQGWKSGDAELTEIAIIAINSKRDSMILKGGEKIRITIRAKTNKDLRNPIIGFIVKDRLGQSLFGENTLTMNKDKPANPAPAGSMIEGVFQLWFPMLPSGSYALTAAIADGDSANPTQHHWAENALMLNVSSSNVSHGLVGAFITSAAISIAKPANDRTDE